MSTMSATAKGQLEQRKKREQEEKKRRHRRERNILHINDHNISVNAAVS